MKRTTIDSSVVLVAVALFAGCSKAPEHARLRTSWSSDAAIQTMNPAQPQATALAVVDGKIAYVGDEQGAQAWIGKRHACDPREQGDGAGRAHRQPHPRRWKARSRSMPARRRRATRRVDEIAPIIRTASRRRPGDGWVIVESI